MPRSEWFTPQGVRHRDEPGDAVKFQHFVYGFLILFLGGIVAFLVFGIGQAQSGSILEAQMISPRYRNAIYPTMDDPEVIRIRIRIELSQAELDQTSIDVVLSRNADVIKTWQIAGISENDVIELPVSDVAFEYTRSGPYVMDDNPYQFKLELKKQGILLDATTLELNKYPPPPTGVNEVRVDDDDNIVINGEKKFIYGTYLLSYDTNWYRYLEDQGFIAFLELGPQLSGYHSESSWGVIRTDSGGIEGIASARRNIREYRAHPQLLAYRLIDEPNSVSHQYSPDLVRQHYQVAKEEDPYHPAIVVMSITSTGRYFYSYAPYVGCQDIIFLDVYPLFVDSRADIKDIRNVYRNYELLQTPDSGYSSFEHEKTPIGAVPQMWGIYPCRWPYNHEQKNMVYQHLVGGAKSFFPYSYDGLSQAFWDYYGTTIIPELKTIEEAVLAPAVSDSIHIDGSDIEIHSSDPERLVWRHTQTVDKDYLFLVNTSSMCNRDKENNPYKIDETISVQITFTEPGSNTVEVLVSDPQIPSSYALSNNVLTIALDGVNEASTGVLVLARDRTPYPAEDVNLDGSVDILDVDICVNFILGHLIDPSIEARADVNDDGLIDALDIQRIVNRMTQ
jgi:hypothetical protein